MIAETPPEKLTPEYLDILANYLILCMEKQEKKQRKILTENRLSTINKRETSYEGLASQLESGEDGIYNLTNENKNQILQPKISITKKDLEQIPFLEQVHAAIADLKAVMPSLEGKAAYITKRTIIDLSKDQYVIKTSYNPPVGSQNFTVGGKLSLELPDRTTVGADGQIISQGVTLTNSKVCSFILCNYVKLKQECEEKPQSDLWCLMQDFDHISTLALADSPLYEQIVTYKIDGLKNSEIVEKIQIEFGIKHTPEYISCLWRNKIPKMIAEMAQIQYLDWYFLNEEKGKYKKCGHCGQIKLANNKYFSKNKTSKDSWYSICKCCRNKKGK